jgi:hypothetical protein
MSAPAARIAIIEPSAGWSDPSVALSVPMIATIPLLPCTGFQIRLVSPRLRPRGDDGLCDLELTLELFARQFRNVRVGASPIPRAPVNTDGHDQYADDPQPAHHPGHRSSKPTHAALAQGIGGARADIIAMQFAWKTTQVSHLIPKFVPSRSYQSKGALGQEGWVRWQMCWTFKPKC